MKQICPVETTLSLIGGKYKALILWHLSSGTLRFSQGRWNAWDYLHLLRYKI